MPKKERLIFLMTSGIEETINGKSKRKKGMKVPVDK